MSKGERTKKMILEKAMSYASIYGLSSVTIGEIAKVTDLSRTGVISHFKDKEDMQISILKYTQDLYTEGVIIPSRNEDSLARLQAFFKCWRSWIDGLELQYKGGSCPFIKGLNEYMDRTDSKVHDYLMKQQRALIDSIAKLAQRCIEDKYFKETVDPHHFAFDTYSYYLGYNVMKKLFSKSKARKHSELSIEKIVKDSLA